MEKGITGEKKSSINYFTDTNPVDSYGRKLPMAVAMVAKCVAFYRQKMRPLKTIYLCPAYFNQLDCWSRKMAKESEADVKWEMLTFDGVEIKQMSLFHIIKSGYGTEEIDWDFYQPKVEVQA